MTDLGQNKDKPHTFVIKAKVWGLFYTESAIGNR